MNALVLILLAQTMNLNNTSAPVSLPATQSGAFGELLNVESHPVVSISFPYNNISTEYVVTTTDAGTVTADGGHAILTASSTGTAELRSRRAARYIPGQGMMARFTFVANRPCVPGASVEAGVGDDTDAFGFGCCATCSADAGSSFGILRRSGGVDYWTPVSSWNGTWGRTAPDITKGRPYQIEWQWLGYGAISYSIEDSASGQFKLAHRIRYAGVASETSINNPTLPLHAHVVTTGVDGGFVLRVPSMSLLREGVEPNGGLRRTKSATIATSTTERQVFAVRNNTTFNGRVNRTQTNVQLLSYSAGTPAGVDVTVRLRFNPGTTGASFTALSAASSCSSFDTDGGLAPDGGFYGNGVEWLDFIVQGGASGVIDLHPYELHLAPGDVLSVTAQSASGTPSLTAALSWVEDF